MSEGQKLKEGKKNAQGETIQYGISQEELQTNLQASYADYYATINHPYEPSEETSQNEIYQQPQEYYQETEDFPQDENDSLPKRQRHDSNYNETNNNQNSETKQHYFTQNADNDTIYISNLPLDITVSDLQTRFGSIGLIKLDKRTREPKITIYRNHETNEPKGDACITYDDREAAKAAIEWFDRNLFFFFLES